VKILTIALLLVAARVVLVQSNPPTRMPEDVAIFTVRHEAKTFSIEPVVIVHYGADQRFKTIPALNSPLPSRDRTEADFDKVENSFYKPGTPVSMFSGGEKLGSSTVLSSNIEGRDGGCIDLSAVVTYGGSGKPVLAASSTSEIPGHASTRRDATAEETTILRQLAIRWLIDYGLDKQLLQSGSTRQVISTVLREKAGRALIGRFDVESKNAIHRLFAIAEQDQGQYRLTLANLEIQHDVEDGTDKTEREYVDQLDIDSDGQDEVITSASHYEGWSYAVWKFYANAGVWKEKYKGIGGGC
jgi:hypothetical protein